MRSADPRADIAFNSHGVQPRARMFFKVSVELEAMASRMECHALRRGQESMLAG